MNLSLLLLACSLYFIVATATAPRGAVVDGNSNTPRAPAARGAREQSETSRLSVDADGKPQKEVEPPRVYLALTESAPGRFIVAIAMLFGECAALYCPRPLAKAVSAVRGAAARLTGAEQEDDELLDGDGIRYEQFLGDVKKRGGRSDDDAQALSLSGPIPDKYARVSMAFRTRHGLGGATAFAAPEELAAAAAAAAGKFEEQAEPFVGVKADEESSDWDDDYDVAAPPQAAQKRPIRSSKRSPKVQRSGITLNFTPDFSFGFKPFAQSSRQKEKRAAASGRSRASWWRPGATRRDEVDDDDFLSEDFGNLERDRKAPPKKPKDRAKSSKPRAAAAAAAAGDQTEAATAMAPATAVSGTSDALATCTEESSPANDQAAEATASAAAAGSAAAAATDRTRSTTLQQETPKGRRPTTAELQQHRLRAKGAGKGGEHTTVEKAVSVPAGRQPKAGGKGTNDSGAAKKATVLTAPLSTPAARGLQQQGESAKPTTGSAVKPAKSAARALSEDEGAGALLARLRQSATPAEAASEARRGSSTSNSQSSANGGPGSSAPSVDDDAAAIGVKLPFRKPFQGVSRSKSRSGSGGSGSSSAGGDNGVASTRSRGAQGTRDNKKIDASDMLEKLRQRKELTGGSESTRAKGSEKSAKEAARLPLRDLMARRAAKGSTDAPADAKMYRGS